jgi:hypothetical protein
MHKMPDSAKTLKKVCRICGDSFRTKQLRLNHEIACKKITNPAALDTAWEGLTAEQQAQYGTRENLHETCLKMLEKLV